jgi:hypothetical protein
MRDPERLLSVASDADPFERELLASLREQQAPAHVRHGAWQGIAAALVAAAPATAAAAALSGGGAALSGGGAALSGGGGGVSAAAVGGSAASVAGGSLVASGSAAPAGAALAGSSIAPAAASLGGKLALGLGTKVTAVLLMEWALVGALGAGTVGGAIWAAEHAGMRAPESSAQPTAAPVPAINTLKPQAAAVEQTTAPTAPVPEAPMPVIEVAPAPDRAHAQSKHDRIDTLAAESALLQTARADLRSGDLVQADHALRQLRRRFPRGVLKQEREVLQIELSSARGDDAGARKLASRFLRAYPESPHAEQLRPLVAAP